MNGQDNLPPGVSESSIPGNTTEDQAWEELHNWLDAYAAQQGLTTEDIKRFVECGCGQHQAIKSFLTSPSMAGKTRLMATLERDKNNPSRLVVEVVDENKQAAPHGSETPQRDCVLQGRGPFYR